VAAQNGFIFAEKAIMLGELSSSTKKQQRKYVESMLNFAKDGHTYAANTEKTFRDVHMKVSEVHYFSVRGVFILNFRSAPEQYTRRRTPNCTRNLCLNRWSKYAYISACPSMHSRFAGNRQTFGNLSEELRDGVDALGKFNGHIDLFAKWWDYMRMTADGRVTRTEMVKSIYDPLRLGGILNDWKCARNRFADYTHQVQAFAPFLSSLR
jgi:hypothetical protein